MTGFRFLTTGRTAVRPGRSRNWSRAGLALGAVLVTMCTVGMAAVVPPSVLAGPQPEPRSALAKFIEEHTQSLKVSPTAKAPAVVRDGYSATDGVETYVAGGTNHDWAKLVLLLAGFPVTEANVTVFTRWMRQENYYDNWWNRNNPLNNGWGSGGGGGYGRYDSLVTAAENAAEALHGNPGYRGIVAAFTASAPTHVTEAAIWASPWASGHYANGSHWHYTPVPVVKAPSTAW